MCLPKIMFYQKTMFSQKKLFSQKIMISKKNMFHQNPSFDQKPWIHQELCWTRFFCWLLKTNVSQKKHVFTKNHVFTKKPCFPKNQKCVDLMGWPGPCILFRLLWSILRWVILILLAFVLCYEVCHYFDPIPEPNEGAAQEQPQSSPKLCHLWMQGWHQESHQVKKATRDSAG